MAKQKKPRGINKDLNQDSLIEKLVPDPVAPPEVIVFAGFLGKSSRPGYVRLYLTPKLNDYFEISEKDVVHSQPLATELNPMGGTVVWVRREADLLHTRSTPAQAMTEFLGGPIMDAFLKGTNLEGLSGRGILFALAMARPSVIGMSCQLGICPGQSKGYCPTRGESTCFRPLCIA